MNLPEFTAEASLYRITRHYHMAGTPDVMAGRSQVVPHLQPGYPGIECGSQYKDCIARCPYDEYSGTDYVCFLDCTSDYLFCRGSTYL